MLDIFLSNYNNTKLNKDIYRDFNLVQFLSKERSIMLNWENEIKISNMSTEEFINRFTLYAGHIIDEIVEAEEENTLSGEKTDDFCREVSDIAMYIASAASLFNIKYICLFKYNLDSILEFKKNEEININKINNLFIKDSYNDLNINGRNYNFLVLNNFITNGISEIRNLYPQRKWHKVHSDFSKEEYRDILKKSYLICCNMIYAVFTYLSIYFSYSKINEIINEKQDKIIKQSKITGNHNKETN